MKKKKKNSNGNISAPSIEFLGSDAKEVSEVQDLQPPSSYLSVVTVDRENMELFTQGVSAVGVTSLPAPRNNFQHL